MLERLFATRKGALGVGLAAAALAAVLLLIYVKQYRHNVSANTATVQVLVAKSLIPTGTPGSAVGAKNLYELRTVPKDSVRLGAFLDPSSLNSGVALTNIYPGQQLVVGDFGTPSNALDTQVTGGERALSLPIDITRTVNAQISPGDHVDIYIDSGSKVTELFQNITVLVLAPGGGEVTLQVTPTQAAKVALSIDLGYKIWFTLRASVGVPPQPPVVVTAANLAPGK